mgnify:CR=1 FL=1
MRKSKTLTSLMCALCLTTSAYAVNIDQGSDLTVDASSRDHIIVGNKLKMKNSLVGIMIGHDLEMENSEMGTSIGVYNTVKGYNSMPLVIIISPMEPMPTTVGIGLRSPLVLFVMH